MHLTILAGSPRDKSISKRVALHLKEALSQIPDVTIAFINMQTQSLPPIQEVWTDILKVPKAHHDVYQTMNTTDGFVVVSPEYNGGYSATLKNFFDHFPKSTFQHKAWGIVTSSTGAMGGMRAAQQLLFLGAALFTIINPQMIIVPHADKKFSEEGNLNDPEFEPNVKKFLKEMLWLTGLLAKT